MDDIHQQKINSKNIEHKNSINHPIFPQKSQLFSLYNEAISDLSTASDMRIKAISTLTSFGISYTQTKKDYFFSVNVKRHTPNYEILCLVVQYGPFSIEFNLLNVASRSTVHSLKSTNSSKGCCVYIEPSVLEGLVIKCFPKKQEDNFQQLLIKVLKELFIFKIADCLEIGPRLGHLPSFDIIVYQECIQFSMEQCLLSENLPLQYFQEQSWKRLRQKLYLLHQLQIVHMDIKPSNICLSPFTNQLIFIDYGLSAVLLESIGYKTFTLFSGSLNFCSPQMKNCYVEEKQMHIDLYYNDIYSLKSSLKFILQNQEGIQKQKNLDVMKGNIDVMNKDSILKIRKKFIRQFQLQIRVKYLLYMQQASLIIENPPCKEYLLNHLEEILQFCFMLPNSKSIEILNDFINKNKRSETQFMLIKRQNTQEYGILKYRSSENNQLSKRFNFLQKGIYLTDKQIHNCQISPNEDENVRQLLLSEKMSLALPKQVYFQKLSRFISLKLLQSSFAEKIASVQILMGIQKLEFVSGEENTQILKSGSTHILQYFIEQKCNFEKGIPLLYFNIIILNSSPEKLLDIFSRISKKNMNDQIMLLVLFKCFAMIFWAGQLQITLPEFRYLRIEVTQIFINAVRLKKQNMKEGHQSYNQILFLEQFLEITKLQDHLEKISQMMQAINKIDPFNQQLKHQIVLCMNCLLISGNHLQQPINLSSLDCINYLNKQEIYSSSKELEYYHAAILDFFITTHNKKGISTALAKVAQYLDSEELLVKLTIVQQCMRIKASQQQNFYKIQTHLAVLEIIDCDPNDEQGKIISHYSKIIKMSQFEMKHLNSECWQTIELIRSHLLKVYPIPNKHELQIKFKHYRQRFLICELIKIYIRVMRQLYISDPRYPIFFTDLLEVIKDQKPSCNCSSCQTNYRSFIEYNKIRYLNDTKRYLQIIPILDQYLQRKQAYGRQFGYNCIFYMLSVFESKVEFSEALEMRTGLIIKWMNDSNSWINLFYNKDYSSKELELLYGLILKMDMKEQFCSIQRKLTDILAQYPTLQFLQTYSTSLIKSYFYWHYHLNEIAEYILSQKEILKGGQMGQYYALFISFLINYHYVQERLEKVLLLFILKNINKVNSMAKLIIQKNLLFYLTRTSIVWERKQISIISKRNSKAIRRNYFRMPLVKISLNQLQYYYFNGIKRNKLVPKAVRKIFDRLARRFISNCKIQEEQNQKPQQFCLVSPFESQ